MRQRKLFWHILPANLLVTLGALLAVLWYSEAAVRQFYLNSLTTDLSSRIQLISEQVDNMLEAGQAAKLNDLCRRIGRKSKTRITVIRASGVVLADSDEYPANMGNHRNRPEIITARRDGIGTAQRWSATIGTNMLYVAMARHYKMNHHLKAYVLRASMPVSAIDRQLHRIRKNIMAGAIIVSLLATMLVIAVSRRISRPLETLKKQAERLGREDFTIPFDSQPLSSEVAALARAMNNMAGQIRERLSIITRQRNELQTILDSMTEAVLVVDPAQNIVNINAAASRLFAIPRDKARGRNIQELLRNLKLNDLLAQCLRRRGPATGIISLNAGGREQFLQSSAAAFREGDTTLGAVLVFNDITAIKRLENMRRDFVANVSHELMTPLTSIRGYAETVMDVMDDDDAGQSKKFLQVIIRQADQLQAIVDDLLELAKLERETEEAEISLVPGRLAAVIDGAIEACAPRAATRNISVSVNCQAAFRVEMDAPLLGQAVVNLLGNAIKYSTENSRVEINCEARQADGGREAVIMISDHGPGIAREHLSRIFERFYRCDKSRSRKDKQGGTGLGLAIVKHIVELHHGRVWVESAGSRGSTFIMALPMALA